MPWLDTPDSRLYYEVHGPGPGTAPAIVFAHGAGGNHLSWWQQVPHFSDRYTCVIFSHAGFGESQPTSDRPVGAAFVDDLVALVDELALGRVRLVAQSMGGWTCLGFTVRYPQRVAGLVMCDTHGGLTSESIGAAAALARERAVPPLPEGAHPACGARMWHEQPDLHFLYTEIDAFNPPRTREELGAIIRAAGSTPADAVASLYVPSLFIIGEEDIVIPPDVIAAAAKCLPDARIERVPEAGHSVYFERADNFNALIESFLSAL